MSVSADCRRLLLTCSAALILPVSAWGQTDAFWQLAVDGDWSDGVNWSTNPVFPNNNGTDYNAFLNIGGATYTVTLDIPITIVDFEIDTPLVGEANLDLGSNTLTMEGGLRIIQSRVFGTTGNLVVTGDTHLSSSVLEGFGSLMSNGNLFFDSQSGEFDEICDTDIDHEGNNCEWNGDGDILMDQGATFTNGAASTFTILNDRSLTYGNNGAQAVFTNQGTLIKSTGVGTTTFGGVSFDNVGTLQVESGTFFVDDVANLGGGTTLTGGTWNVLNGSTLDFDVQTIDTNEATVTIRDAGSAFAALNNVQTNGAAGSLTLDNTTFATGGSLANLGALTATNGAVVSTGGDLTNDGDVTATNGAALSTGGALFNNNVMTVDAAATVDTTGNLDNPGSLTIGAGSSVTVGPGSDFTSVVTGELQEGTLSIQGRLAYENASISIVNADVTLDGVDAAIEDSLTNADALHQVITDIGANGRLAILNRTPGNPFETATGSDFEVASTGALVVGADSVFRVALGEQLFNFQGGTFVGGIFDITGTLQFDDAAVDIIDNELVLDTPGSEIIDQDGNDALEQLSTIDTDGKLTLRNGRSLATIDSLTVRGQLIIENGGPSPIETIIEVHGDLVQERGRLALGGGAKVQVEGLYDLRADARLVGTGTVEGLLSAPTRVTAAGTISPGLEDCDIGAITVTGDLDITDTGVVEIEIVSEESFDVLVVSQLMSFEGGAAGTLRVELCGFTPTLGQVFPIITADFDGRFDTHNGLTIDANTSFYPRYAGGQLVLVVVPAPGGGLVLAGAAMAASRRRRA